MKFLLAMLLLIGAASYADIPADSDPYLWLEEISGARALDWVRARNEVSKKELEAQPEFAALRSRLLSIFDSNERIPYVRKQGKFFYNFWRDTQHVRGVWRRTTLDEYRKSAPTWEPVLDVDALAAAEEENWVWGGANCRHPAYDRCFVSLSRGGSDARVVREFDLEKKQFVADGFQLPEGKSNLTWRTRDEVFVGTDFGPGSLTTSGYPRIVKLWQRATPLTAARSLFEGKNTDVSVHAQISDEPGYHREFIIRAPDFFTNEYRLFDGKKLRKLYLPRDALLSSFHDQILLTLRSSWSVQSRTFPSGALLAMPWDRFLYGWRNFDVL